MNRTPSFYWIIDHRAPWYVPRSEPHIVSMPIALITVCLGIASVVLVSAGAATWNPVVLAFMALTLWLTHIWARALKRYVIRIPRADMADYYIKGDLLAMQGDYQRNPELRQVMEPVLLASYDLARNLHKGAVSDRRRVVAELVADSDRFQQDPEVDNADLTELRNIIAIRRQMRSEGLL